MVEAKAGQRQRLTHAPVKHRYTYRLTVLQQPELAYVYASDPKGHQPISRITPPTIVQLRITEDGKDVTLHSKSHFFLLASLERVQGTNHSSPSSLLQTHDMPSLGGLSAASMTSLRLPIEAGYFIFPDLSVSHEGKFRLRLDLFESAIKNIDANSQRTRAMSPEAVTWRMRIMTQPFVVYQERQVPQFCNLPSDQNCRIRVRRNIRQRKHEDSYNRSATSACPRGTEGFQLQQDRAEWLRPPFHGKGAFTTLLAQRQATLPAFLPVHRGQAISQPRSTTSPALQLSHDKNSPRPIPIASQPIPSQLHLSAHLLEKRPSDTAIRTSHSDERSWPTKPYRLSNDHASGFLPSSRTQERQPELSQVARTSERARYSGAESLPRTGLERLKISNLLTSFKESIGALSSSASGKQNNSDIFRGHCEVQNAGARSGAAESDKE